MISKWLYPISKNSGRYFNLDDGTKLPVSVENYEKLLRSGRLTEDDWWRIKQNYWKIQKGDEIYIYTGDHNLGIIGYATIREKDDAGWSVQLRFDLNKCRVLLNQPVPARIVRQWIHFPRAAVCDLDPFQAKLVRYLPWSSSYILRPILSVFKDLRLKPFRTVAVRTPTRRRHELAHDELLRPAVNVLKANGFKIGTKSFNRLQADAVGMRDNRVVILEAKSSAQGEGRDEARQAFGQLYEYRWLFRQSSDRRFKYCLWALFESRPDSNVVQFMEDHNIVVSWAGANSIGFTDRSKERFERFTR